MDNKLLKQSDQVLRSDIAIAHGWGINKQALRDNPEGKIYRFSRISCRAAYTVC